MKDPTFSNWESLAHKELSHSSTKDLFKNSWPSSELRHLVIVTRNTYKRYGNRPALDPSDKKAAIYLVRARYRVKKALVEGALGGRQSVHHERHDSGSGLDLEPRARLRCPGPRARAIPPRRGRDRLGRPPASVRDHPRRRRPLRCPSRRQRPVSTGFSRPP